MEGHGLADIEKERSRDRTHCTGDPFQNLDRLKSNKMKAKAMPEGVITEADTCREFVTPRLVEAGWGTAPHVIGEQTARAAQAKGDGLYWQIYNLELKNPNAKAGLAHAAPKDLIGAMRSHEAEVMRLLGEIEALVAEVQA